VRVMGVLDKIVRMNCRRIAIPAEDDLTNYDWTMGPEEYNIKGCPRCGWQHQTMTSLHGIGWTSFHEEFFWCKRCKLEWCPCVSSDERCHDAFPGGSNYTRYEYVKYVRDDDVVRNVDIALGCVWEGFGDREDGGVGLFIVRVERAED